jgi:hypothetical protein
MQKKLHADICLCIHICYTEQLNKYNEFNLKNQIKIIL